MVARKTQEGVLVCLVGGLLVTLSTIFWKGWVAIASFLQIPDEDGMKGYALFFLIVPLVVYLAFPGLLFVPLLHKIIVGGACVGATGVPFVIWYSRKLGIRKIIGFSFLSILTGAWLPYFGIAMLAIMVSD